MPPWVPVSRDALDLPGQENCTNDKFTVGLEMFSKNTNLHGENLLTFIK